MSERNNEWHHLMREYESGNNSIESFCSERGIDLVKFKSKRKNYQKLQKKSFIPVSLEPEVKSAKIEFPGGVVISFNF
jgi:hypothetical protein